MYRRIVQKASNLLYKLHLHLNEVYINSSGFVPYKINYQLPFTEQKKIVHINGNFIVGGSSQLIVDIIEHTSDKYNHIVIVPEIPNPLPYQPVTINEFDINKLDDLFDFLKFEQPDLVHIHYWVRYKDRYKDYAVWYQAVFKICEDLGLKVLQNINVPTSPFLSSSVTHNIYVSEYVRENFGKDFKVTSSVIHPGSNFSHFINTDDSSSLPSDCIGMVYRLDPDKLNKESIEVFISCVKKQPNLKCYIVGGGAFLEYYKVQVNKAGLKRNFIFTGYVSYDALPQLYKSFSLFVAPVHDESFGQVTPFAMSMGLCVVGYNVGALPEILGSSDTLVESGDTDALSNKIVELINNPTQRISIGNNNKKRAHAKFSVDSMISSYREVYNKYIS